MSKIIEISEETWAKIKDQVEQEGGKEFNDYNDLVGSKFFFRTVTYHLVGEVKKIVGRFAYLKNASWIADSGRFNEAIGNGTLSEVEYVGDAFVNVDTVTDFFPWKHDLPKKSK